MSLDQSPKTLSLQYLSKFDCSVYYTRTVVRECCKGDDASQRGNGKFDPLPRLNPLTDCHQKLRTSLGAGYLPTNKIQSRSLEGFSLPCMREIAHQIYTLGFFFWVLPSPTAQASGPIFTHNTSNDAVPRKDVHFLGYKANNLTFKLRNSRKTASRGNYTPASTFINCQ